MLAGLEIKPVQERAPYLNMMIYGESGVGKTTLAGSADEVPLMRPVIFVDVEGGTQSLLAKYPDVDHVRVTNWNQMADIYNALSKGTDYQTVVLDSLTEIQKFNMYEIMRQQQLLRPDLDPDIPGMREWGKNSEQIRKFVRLFRDLPMHTIFTALAKSDKDDKTGRVTKKPSLSGKLADEVAAFLDVVVYYYMREIHNPETDKDEQVRLLLTQKTESTIAKDRTGRLEQVIQAPTMKSLFDQMTTKPKTRKD
jgi:phage nucleotide-binding protein